MRAIWRRYRWTLGLALVTSAILGLLCGLTVYLAGNSDYRAQSGWGGFAYWMAVGALCGVITGVAASLGGGGAMVLRDRRLSRERGSRVALGAVGAGVGSALPWGVVGVASAVTGGAGHLYVFIGISVAVSLMTAVLAGIMLTRAERRQDGGSGESPASPPRGH